MREFLGRSTPSKPSRRERGRLGPLVLGRPLSWAAIDLLTLPSFVGAAVDLGPKNEKFSGGATPRPSFGLERSTGERSTGGATCMPCHSAGAIYHCLRM